MFTAFFEIACGAEELRQSEVGNLQGRVAKQSFFQSGDGFGFSAEIGELTPELDECPCACFVEICGATQMRERSLHLRWILLDECAGKVERRFGALRMCFGDGSDPVDNLR